MTSNCLQNTAKVSTPSPMVFAGFLLQRKCACGGSASLASECDGCSKKLSLQRSAENAESATRSSKPESRNSELGGVPPIVQDVLRSSGRPLDAETRAFFEPRFGHDFSSVRVHTDRSANESARAVNALAYTVGSDLVFGNQQYAPQTASGARLLAHELAHVVQQCGQTLGSLPGQPGLEREAEVAADSIEKGGVSKVSAGSAPGAVPQFADDPAAPHEERTPTPQEFIAKHTNLFGLNLDETGLANDLSKLAWQSPEHYKFVVEVFTLLDSSNRVEVAEAFFTIYKSDTFLEDLALTEAGRIMMKAIVSYLPQQHAQRRRVDRIVSAGPQNEVEKERTASLEQLEKKGKNVDITMYTSYKGQDLAESQLESIAKSQKNTGKTDEIFPMEFFEDIQAYLEALHKASGATDFVRELHLMGHGTEDMFGFGRYYYSSTTLKKYATGTNALYMADGATIYLEGCNVAKGETGRKYVAEIGRIFFGEKKTGFIKGNTCEALDLLGVEMAPCDPRTLRWPGDLK